MRIFRAGPGPHALPLAMAGVKMGERVLDIGAAAASLFAEVAGKVGLTGRACAVVGSEAAATRVKAAAAKAGVLVEVEVTSWPALPVGDAEFDLAVLDETDHMLGGLEAATRVGLAREVLRALRDGGRVLVVEEERRGWLGRGRRQAAGGAEGFQQGGGPLSVLKEAGFAPVRILAEREGKRFTEGWRPAESPRP